MTKQREVHLSCFYPRCEEFSVRAVKKGARMGDAYEEHEGEAGEIGWVIGLDGNGQAHYGCPLHGHLLFDANKLTDNRSRFRQLFRPALVVASPPAREKGKK